MSVSEQRISQVAGVAMMLVPVLSVIGFAVGANVGEYDLFARDEMDDLLLAINEHLELYALSLSAQVTIDAIWLPLVAGTLYLLLRDRGQALALLGTLGLMLGAALFLAHDSAVMTVGWLAADFAEQGGAGSIPVGADSTLEVARAIAIFEGVVALCALTVTGFGLASYGALLVWAPRGLRTPPRWLGFVTMVGGACYLATWTFLLDHTVGGVFTLVGELAVLVAFAGLGFWFFRHATQSQPIRRAPLSAQTGS